MCLSPNILGVHLGLQLTAFEPTKDILLTHACQEQLVLLNVGTLRAHIDRTQAARLYAGNIEYGYFVREMEARCQQAGVAAGKDADQLITFAASLPEEQLRSAALQHKTRTRAHSWQF